LVDANPKSAKARLLAARHYLGAGRREEADKHVRYALETLRADGPEALLLAADVAAACRRPDEARAHLERGVKLHPKDPSLRRALARARLRAGLPGEAAKVLAPSLKELPENPLHLWELGSLLLEAGKTAELEEILQRLQALGHQWAVGLLRGRR